jgi:beta-alanine degradation protein BauB
MKTPHRAALLAVVLVAAIATWVLADREDAPSLETQKVLLENARVRVLEYRSKPSGGLCGAGSHSHPPHVTVVLARSRDHAVRSDGKVEEGELEAGDVFWSDGETHTDVNTGTTPSYLIVIELKDAATGAKRIRASAR